MGPILSPQTGVLVSLSIVTFQLFFRYQNQPTKHAISYLCPALFWNLEKYKGREDTILASEGL